MGIPYSLSDLIDSPMEEFNTLLANSKLSEDQLTLCRDIRRRGKNKVRNQTTDIYNHRKNLGLGMQRVNFCETVVCYQMSNVVSFLFISKQLFRKF